MAIDPVQFQLQKLALATNTAWRPSVQRLSVSKMQQRLAYSFKD